MCFRKLFGGVFFLLQFINRHVYLEKNYFFFPEFDDFNLKLNLVYSTPVFTF